MRKNSGKYGLIANLFAICFLGQSLNAQTPDSLVSEAQIIVQDSIPSDSLPLRDSAIVDFQKLRISPSGLDQEISYHARDSMWADVRKRQVHLYGAATVKYSTIDLKAGYILLDYESNTVTAKPFADSSGTLVGLPEFKDKDQSFTAQELKYNFKTSKGIIYQTRTKQDDLYVLGDKAKFIGADADTTKSNQIYNQNALITTCNAEHPHYGIRTNKLKVVPDKLVVTGFSNLEIGGVPTPLFLPFGFYPITKNRKSGLIIPRDFEFGDQEGLGIKDWGYYIPLGQKADVTFNFDMYFQGSYRVGAVVRYVNRYKNNGNFNIRYNNRVTENSKAEKVTAKSFGLNWSHVQDAKAHPTRKFGGNVSIETNRDQSRNQNTYDKVYQNTLSSNLTYSKTFPGKPFSFTASMNHSQNTQSRQMTINLPNLTFTMQRIYPFKLKERVGKEKWFEKISLNYNAQGVNTFNTTDTTLFSKKTLDDARFGIQHRASTDYQIKLFKYINLTPSISYEENWYWRTVNQYLADSVVLKYDTTLTSDGQQFVTVDSAGSKFGVPIKEIVKGFKPFRKYDVGISANTALFFTKQFKKGWLRGIRHTFKPSVSMGFGPDFTKPKYDYFRSFDTDLRVGAPYDAVKTYGIFDEAVYSRPSNSPRSVAIGYSLGNILEMKYYSKRDSAARKVKIFDNLTFSGSYSLTADTLKWSVVSTGGVFRFFKNITNITWSAQLDPYIADPITGRRINKFVLKEKGKLLRLTNFSFGINTNFGIGQLRTMLQKSDKSNSPGVTKSVKNDDLLGLFENCRVGHRLGFTRAPLTGDRDTFYISSHSLQFSGDLPLSSKWKFNIANISYDFQAKSLVYPDIGITRDLHCWQMSLRWQPAYGTYEFFINVNPGTLDFLKVPYRKSRFDTNDPF